MYGYMHHIHYNNLSLLPIGGLLMTDREKDFISKGQISDVNNRIIFKNHTLCAQFLRDYIGLDIFKNVRPEDIVDVTEKYQKYLGISFDTDTVKRVHIRGTEGDMPMYLISLIEHKSDVDYNVIMQLLQYMTCIWHDYEVTMKNNNLGNAKSKDFLYPPILPIVYYEGKRRWTAPMSLGKRIFMSDVFSAYVPDFTYKLINLHEYTNDELLSHEDEMSFLMMLNKIQSVDDFTEFLNVNREHVKKIIDGASEGMMEIITGTLWNMLMKMNLSVDEAHECVKELGERNMGNWFENMDKMDIQAERRNTAEARRELAEAKEKLADAESKLSDTNSKLLHMEKTSQTQTIISIINMTKKYSDTKESAILEVTKTINVSKDEAERLVDRYW